jgi:hypothetical protein
MGANLGGDWVAWISAGTTKAIDALTFDGAYQLVTGVEVAPNKAAFLSGALSAPIDTFENGAKAPTTIGVWTGTGKDGTVGQTCDAWTTTSALKGAIGGSVDQKNGSWTDNGGIVAGVWPCNVTGRLYCFER